MSIVLLVATVSVLPAQSQPFACGKIVQPESVGLNSKQLGRIEQVANNWVKQGQIAGCSAMVIRQGKVAYFKAFGNSDREQGRELRRDTIFRIYSMSKPVTSVAALQLVEQGKIDLDAPVSKYLPDFRDMKVLENGKQVAARREFTVRDLMSHTSGLTYGFFGNTAVDREYRKQGILLMDRDLQHMCQKLANIPLLYQPGERFHYSASTDVLGHLVEVVSGKTLADYLADHVFEPLGMSDSGFMVPANKRERFAQLYRPGEASGRIGVSPKWESFRFLNMDNQFYSGGSGLCSTIDDYGVFAQMLANYGELNGTRILERKTLEQAFTNQLKRTGRKRGSFQFGLGFQIADRGKRGVDYGWGGAAGTRFWSNPDEQMVVLFMVQIKPTPGQLGERVRDVAYRAVMD